MHTLALSSLGYTENFGHFGKYSQYHDLYSAYVWTNSLPGTFPGGGGGGGGDGGI